MLGASQDIQNYKEAFVRTWGSRAELSVMLFLLFYNDYIGFPAPSAGQLIPLALSQEHPSLCGGLIGFNIELEDRESECPILNG